MGLSRPFEALPRRSELTSLALVLRSLALAVGLRRGIWPLGLAPRLRGGSTHSAFETARVETPGTYRSLPVSVLPRSRLKKRGQPPPPVLTCLPAVGPPHSPPRSRAGRRPRWSASWTQRDRGLWWSWSAA